VFPPREVARLESYLIGCFRDGEPYYASSRMTAVVMPLLDLMDARKEAEEAVETP
jgi:hypothetical protein